MQAHRKQGETRQFIVWFKISLVVITAHLVGCGKTDDVGEIKKLVSEAARHEAEALKQSGNAINAEVEASEAEGKSPLEALSHMLDSMTPKYNPKMQFENLPPKTKEAIVHATENHEKATEYGNKAMDRAGELLIDKDK